jgi:hypothetical protein
MASEYIKTAITLADRKTIIKDLTALIKGSKIDFDAIALRGLSGAMIAPVIADKLNKPLIICRKDDGHHSNLSIEYADKFGDFIIIDDLISSGDTICHIMKMIDDEWKKLVQKDGAIKRPRCVGIFLYNSWWDTETKIYVRNFYARDEILGEELINFYLQENFETNIEELSIPARHYRVKKK